jgi:predicted amidophosphoribosyltransferase
MSLIPCRSCERPLSKDAKTCPNCGAKKPTKHKKPTDYRRLGKLLLILLAVYVVAIILSKALGLKVILHHLLIALLLWQKLHNMLKPIKNVVMLKKQKIYIYQC